MTVIVGSLFLPYTVHFQIAKDQYDYLKQEDSSKLQSIQLSGENSIIGSNNNSTSQFPIIDSTTSDQASIIPSLLSQKLNLSSSTPKSQSSTLNNSIRSDTPEGFFYNQRNILQRNKSNSNTNTLKSSSTTGSTGSTGVTSTTTASPDHHYIQPRPRLGNRIDSSILDPKKPTSDGVTSIKISRSSTNLSSSSPNYVVNSGIRPPNHRSNSSFLRNNSTSTENQKFGFTIHGNSSYNSILSEEGERNNNNNSSSGGGAGSSDNKNKSNTENNAMIPSSFEDEDEDGLTGFEKNYKHSVSNNRRLAPFGGFSKPGIEHTLWNEENIFDTAEWTVDSSDDGNGSLTKALDISVKNGILDQNKWVGIIAMPSDTISEDVKNKISSKLSKEYNCDAVFPNDITFEGHYKSFCKQILWPTLHYQIPDDPKSKAFEDHTWGHYKLMNQIIANKLVETFIETNGDCNFEDSQNMIWIHDYHLLLVPKMIREKLPNVKIGFFLHVSFPSSEVFRCFAQRNELLEGMLGANCISFQTNEYIRHFRQTCNTLLNDVIVNDNEIIYKNQLTIVNTIPVGIDSPSLRTKVYSEEVKEWRKLIRERWNSEKLIISRDKLDKLRGIKQKLLAYEKFLINNPKFIEDTVLIQICIGSSSDQNYENEIMKIISRINSLPENISINQPVVLLQKDIEFEQYLALQCEAETFIVSSMREGLNLTCHEFITATEEKKSPLILSEFTGSSDLLSCNGKGAQLINPWDLKKFSETFLYALNMSKDEKLKRWENCHHFVLTQDSKHWVEHCLESINNAWDKQKQYQQQH
ncbi:TPS3 [Candida pseudojiufengensis]|uniref:TPS3 n=1 Tax=Candida pseudojiufengensis TaxID=497109 RepID=UPI002224740F|nr:TPS3 [Candida pseudojiufengensis]KAI5960090.1 TPS3 [Candida pseudojiufengensis]